MMLLRYFNEMDLSTLIGYFYLVVSLYTEHIKSISMDHLKRMMDSGQKYLLIDVRSRQDYDKEHIAGAKSIPLDEIEKFSWATVDPDQQIITYCDSFVCSSSTSAAKILARKGFKNIVDYKGGLREWKQAGYPTEKGP